MTRTLTGSPETVAVPVHSPPDVCEARHPNADCGNAPFGEQPRSTGIDAVCEPAAHAEILPNRAAGNPEKLAERAVPRLGAPRDF